MALASVIGVLALQGAFAVHAEMLAGLGAEVTEVKRPDQLNGLQGLVIPGGESTTLLKHLERGGFFTELQGFVEKTPTFGTCAGAILLAKTVTNPEQASLDVLDVEIERNAYGRQRESAILTLETTLAGGELEMVFIRAPRITSVGEGVEVLATRDASPVLVRQGHILAATFHPELSQDTRVHGAFLSMVEAHRVALAGVTV